MRLHQAVQNADVEIVAKRAESDVIKTESIISSLYVGNKLNTYRIVSVCNVKA
jgi:hypothetical protein